ncbi:MAG: phosphonate C-P lyase system protein PhnH [Pseudomonadota bacterium]
MAVQPLGGGFCEPSTDAAHAFRRILEAMARPGTFHTLQGAVPPAPLSSAAGAVLLTLCDADTPLHLAGSCDCEDVRQWVAFHTGAPISPAAECTFAVGPWEALAPTSQYRIGTAAYPDRSATLIVELPHLVAEDTRLRGPGIRTTAELSLPDVAAFQDNHALFPRGLDFFFTAETRVAALPRSTEVLPCT